jgi:CheY-like chemotaxis protein
MTCMADTEHFDYKTAIGHIEETIRSLQPPKNLLLVDDDLNDVKLNLSVLNLFNVNVKVASSGVEARELIKTTKFDLVLFDLVMPGLDGLEFALGAAGLLPGARFILVTGYPLSPKVEAVLRLGAVMLAKPITKESLELILPLKV